METHRRTDIENNMASAGINVRFAVQYEAWISSGSAGCRPVKGTAITGGQDARVVHTDYLADVRLSPCHDGNIYGSGWSGDGEDSLIRLFDKG
jgi:hypothetical protein